MYHYLNTVRPVKLELGEDYIFHGKNPDKRVIFRLIKTTPKGYNFLNLGSSKCVFRHHMYPIKDYQAKEKETWFYVPNYMCFTKLYKEDDSCMML